MEELGGICWENLLDINQMDQVLLIMQLLAVTS